MNLKDYLSVTPEIQEAIDAGKPVVALESTILSHGMPYPQNVEFAHKVEEIVRAEGAVPATTAIMGGKLKVGLNAEELLVMCKAEGVGKVSRRDVAVYLATGMTGATTVATTMLIAAMAGIRFFATGGIGGVHRGAEKTMDISADLQELANTPVCVVCAGAKSILDLGLTLEYLETQGVPVLGLRTDELPAFYCRTSGFKLDYNCKDEETVAKIMKAKWDIGLKGGAVVGNPIPEQYAMDPNYMNGIIDKAVAQANAEHIHGKAITPYLLAHIKDMTEGKSFAANLELACKAIDGTILNPGDEFSFNKIVGERTPEKGYQSAIVYQTGGKSEAEAGGGVCQVASTIYTACLYADLKVTERAPHMFTVTYVQLGMDATIYWGSLDYKFVNSTDHPLRIDASVSGGYVHVKLVGTAPKDKGYDHIVLRHEVVATVQPKMEIDGDKTIITDAGTALDENGNTVNIVVDKDGNKYIKGDMVQYSYVGKTVMAYRDYVDANGTVIKTETLHKDTYQARNTSYKCTPYVEPEVPEEPDPIDPDYPDNPDDPTEPDDPINPWD